MSKKLLVLPLIAWMIIYAGPASAEAFDPKPRVIIETSVGVITLELNAVRAPLTVKNFLEYVDSDFYSETIFHRVVEDFVIQGGGFGLDLIEKPTLEEVANESGNGLSNTRGTIAMARTNDPHSASSQFYINLKDNTALDPNPTRWGYTVFGTVIDGFETIDKIGAAETGANSKLQSNEVPKETITIKSIERVSGPAKYIKK